MSAVTHSPADTPHSLEEIHGSVAIPPASWWRRFLAFSGPAFLVSVGYMDPGNWGTDIEAGSKYGYQLLWVLVASNMMAVLLQTLATRLGVVTGQDLAQACRDTYPRRAVVGLWVLCEIAIAATDLAEVIGAVIALKLLFRIPYLWGLVIAAGDTFLLLALQRRGVRLLEMITLLLVAIIAGSFVVEIILARPDWGQVVRGFLPGLDQGNPQGSLYVAIGMLGATVMPHNLYLHSALVQTRAFAPTPAGKRQACRYNLFDSLLALNGAFFVNAAILVLAVATFHGRDDLHVETLIDAHRLLGGVWGTQLASVLFAVALLASGQSSTLTGTLAGQVVMEGFLRLRVRPWVRRLVTRTVALAPALFVLALAGSDGEGADERLTRLLVLSQVVLAFQLPFAIVPLVHFTSDRKRMGDFANGTFWKVLAWSSAAFVVVMNIVYLTLQVGDWGEEIEKSGWSAAWVYGTIGPTAGLLIVFLGWLTFYPMIARRRERRPTTPPITPSLAPVLYQHIGVAVEFVDADAAVLTEAAALARAHEADLVLLHVVEGIPADYHGPDADDLESRSDRAHLAGLVQHLRAAGLKARGLLGYGEPAKELARLAREEHLNMLVLGTHGHGLLSDLALGQTVSPLLHRLAIPILVVPSGVRGGPAKGK